jgi:hypothetical protein
VSSSKTVSERLHERIRRIRDGLGAGGWEINAQLERSVGDPILDAVADAIDEECNSDETSGQDLSREVETLAAQLNAVWSHCRVVFYPPMDDPRGDYPLEHTNAARKDMRAVIEHRLSEITKRPAVEPTGQRCSICETPYIGGKQACRCNAGPLQPLKASTKLCDHRRGVDDKDCCVMCGEPIPPLNGTSKHDG